MIQNYYAYDEYQMIEMAENIIIKEFISVLNDDVVAIEVLGGNEFIAQYCFLKIWQGYH